MAQIIEIEDQGQDFTKFCIDENNIIVDAGPFQGWLWKGFQVIQKRIRPGMKLRLRKRGSKPLILKYPVISVRKGDQAA